MRFLLQKRQNSHWPDALRFLSEALRSGMEMESALKTLQFHWKPFRDDLEGLSFDARIEKLFNEPGLALPRAALLLSRETGAKTADILEKAAEVMQEKFELNEKIKTMTAQGRASAWIVGLSPLVLFFGFAALAPDYISPLVKTKAGWGVLGLSVLLIAVGLVFVHRVARVET